MKRVEIFVGIPFYIVDSVLLTRQKKIGNKPIFFVGAAGSSKHAIYTRGQIKFNRDGFVRFLLFPKNLLQSKIFVGNPFFMADSVHTSNATKKDRQ